MQTASTATLRPDGLVVLLLKQVKSMIQYSFDNVNPVSNHLELPSSFRIAPTCHKVSVVKTVFFSLEQVVVECDQIK